MGSLASFTTCFACFFRIKLMSVSALMSCPAAFGGDFTLLLFIHACEASLARTLLPFFLIFLIARHKKHPSICVKVMLSSLKSDTSDPSSAFHVPYQECERFFVKKRGASASSAYRNEFKVKSFRNNFLLHAKFYEEDSSESA
ncbi:MAG TPA: hypothetical protein VFO10_03035 [Oligoflexus sp.]|nr:hypothetical protein [Oligoflexus sp.]HET9236198.1 hypothetical protein [Oligoflexus sp.]